jgi:hypothetical protein
MIKGDFIEDMERIQELYQARFANYSAQYHFEGKDKMKSKMEDYQNCVEKMDKVMKFINQTFL